MDRSKVGFTTVPLTNGFQAPANTSMLPGFLSQRSSLGRLKLKFPIPPQQGRFPLWIITEIVRHRVNKHRL